MTDQARDQAIAAYRKKFLEHRELESRVKKTRFELRDLVKKYDKTEDDLKAIQNMGQIIGEVLKQLDEDRFIVKASSGPRYVVGCRARVNKQTMTAGTRVALDMTTLTIMRTLPREVDPVVFNMINESPGKISYSDIGGLNEQIRELREVIELPLTNPELFKRVGIKPPKGVLLYGPPGTGKTLLARALANNIKASYLKVVASAIVDKYIGECFAPGTQILMADASNQSVENIKPGDQLVGDDGTIRTVQPGSLVHDYGEMFKIVNSDKSKDIWYCTKNHILVLKISEPPSVVTHRGKYVIRQWDLEETRNGPLITHRPVRRMMNSGSKTSSGADVPLRFVDKSDAEAYLASVLDCWRPVVFECTVGDFVTFNAQQKAVCAMYAPENGVNFVPVAGSQSLRSNLESAFGRTISDEQLASSAWALSVCLVDGNKGSAIVSQIGVNNKRPVDSHIAVIQELVRWHLSMYGAIETTHHDSRIDDAVLVGMSPAERNTAHAIVRSSHITSSGNRAYFIDLGSQMHDVLRAYGVDIKRTIPVALLSESKSVRRALLAGLIDGAGQLNKSQELELCSQHVEVLEGAVHLARGLGLRAGTIDPARVVDDDKDTTYSGARVIVRGQLSEVKRSQLKQVNQSINQSINLCDSFTVEPAGVQEYYGFQVDGNRRFVLADFTVTHNSARIIREMFGYAKDHQPCVIFMDEVDAIGGRRFSQGTSADREIQRTLMELLNQLDGFDDLGQVKMVMATNRPDTLDPALLRPGRLDRKIEIPIPSESNRLDILKIHAASIAKHGDIDYEAVVKLCEGFNGADLRNVCTEAGMFAIRVERGYTIEEDFIKAARKIAETKKLEGKLDYEKV